MYSSLSNEELLLQTEVLVREERNVTISVLHCLQEVEARLLHAELGYSNIYEFCTKHLNYSNGAAHRRISAMRVLKTLSIVEKAKTEKKIENGSLSLTNLSLFYGFLKTEEKIAERIYSDEQKLKLLRELEHLSRREAERKLASIQPKMLRNDSERVVTDDLTEIRFLADETLIQKLNRVREITAHTHARASYAQLLHKLADEYLKKHDPMMKEPAPQKKATEAPSANDAGPKPIEKTKPSRYIPSAIRQEVWIRDNGRCTYTHAETQNRCGSKFGLEIDHIEPYAFGGKHEVANLRLLCRTHNALAAKKMFLK